MQIAILPIAGRGEKLDIDGLAVAVPSPGFPRFHLDCLPFQFHRHPDQDQLSASPDSPLGAVHRPYLHLHELYRALGIESLVCAGLASIGSWAGGSLSRSAISVDFKLNAINNDFYAGMGAEIGYQLLLPLNFDLDVAFGMTLGPDFYTEMTYFRSALRLEIALGYRF
jgi:hypothetical protein